MKRRFRISILLLAGILLLGAGLAGLASVRSVMQYAFLPSAGSGTGMPGQEGETPKASAETGTSMLLFYDESLKDMTASFPRLTLYGIKAGVTLGTEAGAKQGNVTVYAIGPSWYEVYPTRLRGGRPIVRPDMENRADVIMLDEKTAFRLFHSAETEGKTILLGDEGEKKEYELVGAADHSRRIGETGEYAAWVPLDQLADCDMMVAAAPVDEVNRFPVFETQARTAFGSYGAGTAIDISKEKSRAMLPLLLVFTVLAIWLLKRWIRWLAGFAKERFQKVKAESKRRYTLPLLPYAAGQLLPVFLLFAATLAACYGVAVLAVSPMKVFPEWIPDALGEYDSWISRFWALATDAARPVSLRTPELIEVQFYGNLILWGTLLILLRAAKKTLTGFGRKDPQA